MTVLERDPAGRASAGSRAGGWLRERQATVSA
jgi:hypothetical protein